MAGKRKVLLSCAAAAAPRALIGGTGGATMRPCEPHYALLPGHLLNGAQ